jgi:hypothetical protein
MADRRPRTEQSYIAWARARVNQWLGNQGVPPNIGLSTDQVASADALVSELEARYTNMVNLRTQAETATGQKDATLAETETFMAGMVDIIDGFAKSTGNPEVYALAGIPAPKKGSARTEAPVPTDPRTIVTPGGNVVFRFSVVTGGGAVYPVQRRAITLDGFNGPWTDMGFATTLKTFTDNNAQAGVAGYAYRAATRLTNGVQSEWSDWGVANLGAEPQQMEQAVAKAKAEPDEQAPEAAKAS